MTGASLSITPGLDYFNVEVFKSTAQAYEYNPYIKHPSEGII